jgi:hypothetical protein
VKITGNLVTSGLFTSAIRLIDNAFNSKREAGEELLISAPQ